MSFKMRGIQRWIPSAQCGREEAGRVVSLTRCGSEDSRRFRRATHLQVETVGNGTFRGAGLEPTELGDEEV